MTPKIKHSEPTFHEDRRPSFHGGKGSVTKTSKSTVEPGKVHKTDADRRGHA